MEDNYREVKKAEPCLKLIHMDQVEVEEIEWLFYPFIPYGKVTIIQGDPGEGKTTVVLQIIAKLTKGEAILSETSEGKSEETGVEPINVIYQTAEDGLGDTIKPRLLAAGADCSRVLVIDDQDQPLTMVDARLEEAIIQTNMYMKRLKAYKQIGYEIAGGLHNDKQTANAIYDGDNYAENYHKDLLDANKNIIISSPAISGTKVYELINLLKEKQLSGVQITIVTWAPDSYGFGDASYWMQLHEEMRKAGFYIKTVEESCERFAVIDQEVVWYGNINLLAKDKVDDSIMRVLSKEIASELMEITFGDNG